MAGEDQHSLRYGPLDNPKAQVRLLKLGTTNSNEDVDCELTTWDMKSIPTYVAVSYTWGDSAPNKHIHINHSKVLVSENCWYVLKQAQTHHITEYIWIDALCINQSNHQEKSAQVSIMGSIYQGATQVLVCVGSEGDDSTELFDGIKLHSVFVESVIARNGVRSKHNAPGKLKGRSTETLEGIGWFPSIPDVTREGLWKALDRLSRRAYFTRLWVVQEILLARRVIMLCGDASVDLEHFRQFYREFVQYEISEELNDGVDGFGRQFFRPTADDVSRRLDAHLDRRGVLQGKSLFQLVHRFRDMECFDTRDKIFGLLALVDWEGQAPMQPDYTKSEVTAAIHASAYIPPSIASRQVDINPLQIVSKLLKALKISPGHAELNDFLLARQNLASSGHQCHISVCANKDIDHDRIEVPVHGYCKLYNDETQGDDFIACLGEQTLAYGRPDRSDILMRNPDERLLQFKNMVANLSVPYRKVTNNTGKLAIVTPSARAGDVLLEIGVVGDDGRYGLVARPSASNARQYRIVGRAIFGPTCATCYGGDLCSCFYPAKMHADLGEQMVVHFHSEDLVVMVWQGSRNIVAIETLVPISCRPCSSYATMTSLDPPWDPMVEGPFGRNLKWWDKEWQENQRKSSNPITNLVTQGLLED